MPLGRTINQYLHGIIRFRNHQKHSYVSQVLYKQLSGRDHLNDYFSFRELLQPFIPKTKNLIQVEKKKENAGIPILVHLK